METVEISINRPVPFKATHPGEILLEELKERRISQKTFSKQIDMRPSHLNDFLHGRRNMTPTLAKKLETALGINADTWMKLHWGYLYDLKAISEQKRKGHVSDMPLSQVILDAINRLGYSNEEVAQLVGVDEKKIEAYTTGKAIPSLKIAGMLCMVLSIAPSTMLGL